LKEKAKRMVHQEEEKEKKEGFINKILSGDIFSFSAKH